MGLFKKLKQGLGIDTVSVLVRGPSSIPASGGSLEGVVTIAAESQQSIKQVHVSLQRCFEWQTLVTTTNSDGQTFENWSSHSKSDDIAVWQIDAPFTLSAGETRELHFTLAVDPIAQAYASAYNMDVWYFLPASAMAGRDLLAEPITYQIQAQVDVEGAMLDKDHHWPILVVEG